MKRKMTVVAALSDDELDDIIDEMYSITRGLMKRVADKSVEVEEADGGYNVSTLGGKNTVTIWVPDEPEMEEPEGSIVGLYLTDDDGDAIGKNIGCKTFANFKTKYAAMCKKEGVEPSKAVIALIQDYFKRTAHLWKKYYSESANLKGNIMKKRVVAHIIMAALQVKAGNFGKAERLMAGLDEDVIEDTTDDLLDLVESSDDSLEVQDDEDLFDTESADLDSEDPFVLPDDEETAAGVRKPGGSTRSRPSAGGGSGPAGVGRGVRKPGGSTRTRPSPGGGVTASEDEDDYLDYLDGDDSAETAFLRRTRNARLIQMASVGKRRTTRR